MPGQLSKTGSINLCIVGYLGYVQLCALQWLENSTWWLDIKVKVHTFIWRLKLLTLLPRSPVRTAGNQRVVVCAIRPHFSPYASHRTAASFTSQSSTAVTHCILIATNLPTPERRAAWLTVSAPGVWIRDPSNSCACKEAWRTARDLTHSATQPDILRSQAFRSSV
jgi:hypothetical protein